MSKPFPPWIDPYRVHPVGPRPALMLPDGTVIDCEDGEVTSEAAPAVRAYSFADWAHDLATDGVGQILSWNNRPIRWRRRGPKNRWQPARSDVVLIDTERPDDTADVMAGLVLVAEWLRFHGGQLTGTPSAASLSLLRASITERLWLGIKAPKMIPMGGRQEMGPSGPGIKIGEAAHWDIPAAYASTLGATVYSGRWSPREPSLEHLSALHSHGTPVIARAVVRVPSGRLRYGPLPRRPRRRLTLWEQMLRPLASDAKPTYPRGKAIRGQWTWSEIQAAHDQGCGVTVTEAWAHVVPGDRRPFAQWWERIAEGRDLGGFAGALVKMMGNSLVGRFFDSPGSKQVLWMTPEGWNGNDLEVPDLGRKAPDLAELVTGAVRAELGRMLNSAGDAVVCAHTDGGWFREGWSPPEDAAYPWRVKERARRLDVLNPNRLAVFPADGGPIEYRVAGEHDDPRRAFGESWAATFKVAYNPGDHVIDPRDSELWAGVDAR